MKSNTIHRIKNLTLLAMLISALILTAPHKANADTDQQTITGIILSAFPTGTTVDYVVLDQNYAMALAVWPDGQRARQIVLVNNGSWMPLRGGGGAFDQDDLVSFGVPSDVAAILLSEADAAP